MSEAQKKAIAEWLRKQADKLDPPKPDAGGGPPPVRGVPPAKASKKDAAGA
jgi:hypothetical protein